ncbi:hypothetical protein IWW57_000057 [Coemansia sp. S610]|uniref:Uncharacterized protein n=1 Tax=Coemansia linderi TaxID=2663919 RepID=A0ACC1KG78_9FUNG|nr:hypothetical protein LPJ60_002375 [Coemansia sp. RSA 2675]KAJ2032739.1 hypothetical protein IWW57_000057 [Coemansia sp. S610]KAJ2393600.1 hypothetical protein H4S02_000107 [Coemansia sp. RSA 2611]KAJ2411899.1 hypothetical protein GGI10_004008 [Coemansia sp. RSA 2530]KAJ2698042.1 hypothetical protein H4218_003543 [Coemansia sp. IMI 209128]KAJ2789541.1 hypothetical protein GGI18_002344 [Coemansia linderi]
MYKAATVARYTHDPAGFKVAELPRPALSSATQVEITVHAASLNPIDFKRAEGMLSIALPEPFPLKLGYDVSGVVSEVGSEVSRFSVGDRVYGRVHAEHAGTIAEYVVAEESALAPIPASVGFEAAAAVPLAGLTAKQALEAGGLQEGQTLFVSGGMGGVGMFALALAKHHFGAKEIITTVSSKKRDGALAMGATRVVDYAQEDYTQVLADTADVALDTVGDSAFYKVIKPNGSAVSVAMLPDGDALDHFRQEAVPLSFMGSVKLAVAKSVVNCAGWFLTRGFRAKNVKYSFIVLRCDGEDLEKTFNPLLESGKLVPAISNSYEFTDEGLCSAFTESRAGHATGKIIIKVK